MNDYSRLPEDWTRAVAANGYNLAQVYAALDNIYGGAKTHPVSPPARADVFRAFHLTPLADVRVVIIGEDPYPDPSQAYGLAFSTPPTYVGPRPTSLGRIFGALRRDLGLLPSQGDLSPWAQRGVLLLNVALTHRVGSTVPDLPTWRRFTEEVLGVIDRQPQEVVWLLWGDFANDIADSVPRTNQRHRTFRNAHPRAGRAKRSTLAQSPPFLAASTFLGTDPHTYWSL